MPECPFDAEQRFQELSLSAGEFLELLEGCGDNTRKYFSRCSLSGDLRKQVIQNCTFEHCSVQNLNVEGADLVCVESHYSVWKNIQGSKLQVDDCVFHGDTFEQCNFTEAHLGKSSFIHCSFNAGALEEVRSLQCSWQSARFHNSSLLHALFDHCDLSCASFIESPLNMVTFNHCDLRGAMWGDVVGHLSNVTVKQCAFQSETDVPTMFKLSGTVSGLTFSK